ncbi:UPF0187 domain membrane protein [Rasamsonia emersonii CBS 393.64]|uniref:UPF0187 domain membrane protein n=1 Tax=Rasamsonia emersonii (strain ATCC 16479 / CBS 393.64 / IMI 116815) TaxID=1408163 RepID=A0A0F4YW68_RASE3|nr:UPF0187 domain membrane protein [Rasamsonia emersonii CBS 393.64]KKA21868.1 UPF0187 domain membrane protein [Rasamsonia emersonii CBS 393.64]
MDSGSGSSGGASAEQNAVDSDGPAPVPADVRSHDQNNNGQPTVHTQKEQDSPHLKASSRPISFTELAAAQQSVLESHMHMLHHGSTDLEHYFVRHGLALEKDWRLTLVMAAVEVSNILLTVLGFVVGLALSFRSSTAYESSAHGSNNLGEHQRTRRRGREGRSSGETVYLPILSGPGIRSSSNPVGSTAINLILAFAVALKHCLRFEPDIAYKDLVGLVGHLDTFAKEAHDPAMVEPRKKTPWKATGEYLGVSFAESNPRKLIKRATKPLGHLPLEILLYLSAYIDECVNNGTLSSSNHQSQLIGSVATLNEVLTGAERVRDTPMPEAYNIAISQIAWIYILVLPFQLIPSLKWLTIPGSVVAAYIILSLVAIGRDLENPFGVDVNDLPLDTYCRQLASELDIITASPPPKMSQFMNSSDNLVLYPLSLKGYDSWKQRSVDEIRAALRTKVRTQPPTTSAESSSSKTAVVNDEEAIEIR